MISNDIFFFCLTSLNMVIPGSIHAAGDGIISFFLYVRTHTYIHIYINIPEKAMAPHSSTLAWKIPWTEESMGSLSQTRLSDFTCTFHFHALEKAMAPHSSVLAWRIPGTPEPGGLPSMGSHRVGHDWSDLAAAAAAAAASSLWGWHFP